MLILSCVIIHHDSFDWLEHVRHATLNCGVIQSSDWLEHVRHATLNCGVTPDCGQVSQLSIISETATMRVCLRQEDPTPTPIFWGVKQSGDICNGTVKNITVQYSTVVYTCTLQYTEIHNC